MKPVTKATLRSIIEQFPTVPWQDGELNELIVPKYGIITGFGALLADIEVLVSADLAEAGPAAVQPRLRR